MQIKICIFRFLFFFSFFLALWANFLIIEANIKPFLISCHISAFPEVSVCTAEAALNIHTLCMKS